MKKSFWPLSLLSILTVLLALDLHAALLTLPKDYDQRQSDWITDALDDDQRGILDQRLDPNSRNHVKSIVVSTGNSQLRAATITSTGYSVGFPFQRVLAGTSTNLRKHPTTYFAGNIDREGVHLLNSKDRSQLLSLKDQSGDAADKLVEEWRALPPGVKRNIGLYAGATDLVLAIKKDLKLAHEKLGVLVAMGLYKRSASGALLVPFNGIADQTAAAELLRLHQEEGIFETLIHLPSDTVQTRSGLPGGYIPTEGEGALIIDRISKSMAAHAGLRASLLNAEEIAMAWWNTSGQQFGIMGNESDRWIQPSLIKDPKSAARFYLADMIAMRLAVMPASELETLNFRKSYVRALLSNDPNDPLSYSEASPDSGLRPIYDLENIDGWSIVLEHVNRLESATNTPPSKEFLKPLSLSAPLSAPNETNQIQTPALTQQANATEPETDRKLGLNLVMTYKNSPDDLWALALILADPHGREALKRGGIIVEGFNTQAVADAIRKGLADLQFEEIPVAAGYDYSEKDIAELPSNYAGEIALAKFDQTTRAFADLAPAKNAKTPTASELILSAYENAKNSNRLVDHMNLGEGIDFTRTLSAHPENWSHTAELFSMGGGRIDPKDGKEIKTIIPTRNWGTVRKEETLGFIEDWGKKAEGGVFVFSSNEIGGSLGGLEADGEIRAVATGNGAPVLDSLKAGTKTNGFVNAVYKHLFNWARVFAWVFRKDQSLEFNPNAPTAVGTTSPLGGEIARQWLLGKLSARSSSEFLYPEIRLRDKLAGGKSAEVTEGEKTGIFWVSRAPGHESLEPLAQSLARSFNAIVDLTLTQKHDRAVRELGPFSPEAKSAYAELTGPSCKEIVKE